MYRTGDTASETLVRGDYTQQRMESGPAGGQSGDLGQPGKANALRLCGEAVGLTRTEGQGLGGNAVTAVSSRRSCGHTGSRPLGRWVAFVGGRCADAFVFDVEALHAEHPCVRSALLLFMARLSPLGTSSGPQAGSPPA